MDKQWKMTMRPRTDRLVGEHIDPAKDKAGLDLKVATEYEGFLPAAGTAVDIDRDDSYKMTGARAPQRRAGDGSGRGQRQRRLRADHPPLRREADETTFAHKLLPRSSPPSCLCSSR